MQAVKSTGDTPKHHGDKVKNSRSDDRTHESVRCDIVRHDGELHFVCPECNAMFPSLYGEKPEDYVADSSQDRSDNE